MSKRLNLFSLSTPQVCFLVAMQFKQVGPPWATVLLILLSLRLVQEKLVPSLSFLWRCCWQSRCSPTLRRLWSLVTESTGRNTRKQELPQWSMAGEHENEPGKIYQNIRNLKCNENLRKADNFSVQRNNVPAKRYTVLTLIQFALKQMIFPCRCSLKIYENNS